MQEAVRPSRVFRHQKFANNLAEPAQKEALSHSWPNLKLIRRIPEGEKFTDKEKNIAVFTNPEHEIFVVEKEKPKPSRGQVLIHVRACGICGSDLHFAKDGRIGEMVVRNNHGVGHEASGEIIECGEGVIDFKPGDRVAIEPGVGCMRRSCRSCSKGMYNQCPQMHFCSTPPLDGLMTRFHAHPADYVFKLPDTMSYIEGALMEPLCVALAAFDQNDVKGGDAILVMGSGTIGLMAATMAHALGCGPIYIMEHIPEKMRMATKLLPFAKQVNVDLATDSLEIAHQFLEDENEVDIRFVLECTGREEYLRIGCHAAGVRGHVHVIGCGPDDVSIPIAKVQLNELRIQAQYRYAHTWERAIRMVESGQINIKQFASHFVPLESGPDAFAISSDFTQNATKVLVIDYDTESEKKAAAEKQKVDAEKMAKDVAL